VESSENLIKEMLLLMMIIKRGKGRRKTQKEMKR
jgi:hypothetical protein